MHRRLQFPQRCPHQHACTPTRVPCRRPVGSIVGGGTSSSQDAAIYFFSWSPDLLNHLQVFVRHECQVQRCLLYHVFTGIAAAASRVRHVSSFVFISVVCFTKIIYADCHLLLAPETAVLFDKQNNPVRSRAYGFDLDLLLLAARHVYRRSSSRIHQILLRARRDDQGFGQAESRRFMGEDFITRRLDARDRQV